MFGTELTGGTVGGIGLSNGRAGGGRGFNASTALLTTGAVGEPTAVTAAVGRDVVK